MPSLFALLHLNTLAQRDIAWQGLRAITSGFQHTLYAKQSRDGGGTNYAREVMVGRASAMNLVFQLLLKHAICLALPCKSWAETRFESQVNDTHGGNGTASVCGLCQNDAHI